MASIDELTALIGRGQTEKLVRAFGGTRLYVPRARHPDLEPLIGERAHARLVARFGGERIEVPRIAALERDARVAMAKGLYAAGVSIRMISRRTGLSRRHVARLLRP